MDLGKLWMPGEIQDGPGMILDGPGDIQDGPGEILHGPGNVMDEPGEILDGRQPNKVTCTRYFPPKSCIL